MCQCYCAAGLGNTNPRGAPGDVGILQELRLVGKALLART